MKKRGLICLLLILALCLSLAACGGNNDPAETDGSEPSGTKPEDNKPSDTETDGTEPPAPSTDPLKMITEGYYYHAFTAEGYGEFVHYFHFYEPDPVLGAVFCAGLNNNRTLIAGTYTVEEVPCDYACFPDRATKEDPNAEPTPGTAPYTVTFFDWDGNELGKVGYDGDILYNTMDEGDPIYASGSGTVYYLHDTENSKPTAYEGELGVPFLSFVADDEATSTLQINHNKTYTDLVGAMIEGTWTVEKNADGGLDFTLTPDDSMDTGATVSVSADKLTCTYTPDGGEAIAMSSASSVPEVAYTFTGTQHIESYGVDADVVLNLYSDNTCVATMSVAGSSMELASGAYELDGYTFHFAFTGLDPVDSSVDSTGTMTVQLKVAGTQVGDVDTTLTLQKNEPEIAYTFTGTYHIESYGVDAEVVLNLNSDNTCAATMSVAGNSMDLTAGTYELEGYTFHFAFDGLDPVDSSVDGTGTVTVQLKVAGTTVGDVDTTLTLQK